MVQESKVVNNNYKVVWVYNGKHEEIPEMYDKPIQLCKWWMKMHKRDFQYQGGKMCLVSMMSGKTS